MLTKLTGKILNDFRLRGKKKSIAVNIVSLNTPQPWKFNISFNLGGECFTIKNIAAKHLDKLVKFKDRLSGRSRFLIPCYPWDNKKKLASALKQAIKKSLKHIDASYIIEHENKIIGHFFLWKAGGNPHSLAHGVDMPELGVAVADDFQGRGLGSLAIELMKAISYSLKRDAIELTTAKSNQAGWKTYLKAGFKYTGDINNPLDVDVTEVFSGQTRAGRSRIERQMVYIINKKRTKAVLNYLALKREEAKNFIKLRRSKLL